MIRLATHTKPEMLLGLLSGLLLRLLRMSFLTGAVAAGFSVPATIVMVAASDVGVVESVALGTTGAAMFLHDCAVGGAVSHWAAMVVTIGCCGCDICGDDCCCCCWMRGDHLGSDG